MCEFMRFLDRYFLGIFSFKVIDGKIKSESPSRKQKCPEISSIVRANVPLCLAIRQTATIKIITNLIILAFAQYLRMCFKLRVMLFPVI